MDKNTQRLLLRSANRQIFNPTVIKHRQFDCHIATAKQCGTHWIKYMISLVLCELYDLPLPTHAIEDSVVGHTKTPPKYDHIPQIAVTHSHPHYLLRIPNVTQILKLPKFLILVRDPRDILVSTYEKTKGDYLNTKMHTTHDVTFSEYLRGDITGKNRIEDIWGLMLFFNAWGAAMQSQKENFISMQYEDMKSNTHQTLKEICDYIGIDNVTDDIIGRAIENSSREKMRQKINPDEAQADKSINTQTRNFKDWYNPEDRDFLDKIFDKHLKFNFDYNLKDWT